jgi:hypothetical protein
VGKAKEKKEAEGEMREGKRDWISSDGQGT